MYQTIQTLYTPKKGLQMLITLTGLLVSVKEQTNTNTGEIRPVLSILDTDGETPKWST